MGSFPKVGNIPKNENGLQNGIFLRIVELKSRNLQEIQRVCSTYASGFGRLLDRREEGWE